MNLPHIVRYQLPVLVWMLTIFTLSSLPTISIAKFPLSPDKLAHAGIYFVLCMLWRRALYHQAWIPFVQRQALVVGFCLTAVHGALDEAYQMSVPGRSADIYDTLADIVGAGLFVLWHWWGRHRAMQKNLT